MIRLILITYLQIFPDSPPPLEELRVQLLLELLVSNLDGAERLVELCCRPLDGLFVDGVLGRHHGDFGGVGGVLGELGLCLLQPSL